MRKDFMPIRSIMKMSQSLSDLYKLFEKLKGPVEARNFVTTIVNGAIFDMQEAGLEMSADELEKRINKDVEDFLEVARKTNVA